MYLSSTAQLLSAHFARAVTVAHHLKPRSLQTTFSVYRYPLKPELSPFTMPFPYHERLSELPVGASSIFKTT